MRQVSWISDVKVAATPCRLSALLSGAETLSALYARNLNSEIDYQPVHERPWYWENPDLAGALGVHYLPGQTRPQKLALLEHAHLHQILEKCRNNINQSPSLTTTSMNMRANTYTAKREISLENDRYLSF